MRKWFEPELDFLERNWSWMTAKEIGEILKFSESAVSSMASKMGLKKPHKSKRQLLQRMSFERQMSFHDRYISERLNGNLKTISYVTRASSLGGAAERMFAELIPEAIDANQSIHINNPNFDFIYKDLTIDVKYSSAHKRKESHSNHWSVRTSGEKDLIVAFLERKKGMELDEPYIFVIWKALMPCEKIEIHENGKYGEMFVEANDLQRVLNNYQKLKEFEKKVSS